METMEGYKVGSYLRIESPIIHILQAADWGLANPLWKGRLRILERGSTGATILLEDGQTGASNYSIATREHILLTLLPAFARAPYNNDQAVQPVLDSSRYFVIRVEDPASGNRAFLGIGFTDRTESFDFSK